MSNLPFTRETFTTEMSSTYGRSAHDLQLSMMWDYVDKHWWTWQSNYVHHSARSPWEELVIYIWMNFSGGGTAENVVRDIKVASNV